MPKGIKRNHANQTYGALQVGNRVPGEKDRYETTYTCCGRTKTMDQSTLNFYRQQPIAQCIECRRAGKPKQDLAAQPVWCDSWGWCYPLGEMGHRHGAVHAAYTREGS